MILFLYQWQEGKQHTKSMVKQYSIGKPAKWTSKRSTLKTLLLSFQVQVLSLASDKSASERNCTNAIFEVVAILDSTTSLVVVESNMATIVWCICNKFD